VSADTRIKLRTSIMPMSFLLRERLRKYVLMDITLFYMRNADISQCGAWHGLYEFDYGTGHPEPFVTLSETKGLGV
jgi:hypothetical protein